jgi:hypothetical protein
LEKKIPESQEKLQGFFNPKNVRKVCLEQYTPMLIREAPPRQHF